MKMTVREIVPAELKFLLSPGDAVLVKDSRGMHTDKILRTRL